MGSGKNHAEKARFLTPALAGVVAVVLLTACQTSSSWREVKTPTGPVWRAESDRWRAEVEPARGRLTYLGPQDGPNLLHRPENPASNLEFGGHRVWLGPQSEWSADWPPPENWEMQPARRILSRPGGRLVVESFSGPMGEPSIRRDYRWICGGVLESRASWREDSPKGRQSVQILQVESSAVVEATAKPVTGVPLGFVRLPLSSRPDTQRVFERPRHVRIQRDQVLVRLARTEEKLGFPVQTLVARWPTAGIRLHPGRSSGRVVGEPDGIYRSQVYLGSADWPVLEIEQLSPRLLPCFPRGRVSHTILVELVP